MFTASDRGALVQPALFVLFQVRLNEEMEKGKKINDFTCVRDVGRV